MNLLEDYIHSIHPLSKKSLKKLTDLFEYKVYKAKDIICKIDAIPTKTFFLKKGMVKTYTFFPNNKKYIRRIYANDILFSSYTALIKRSKSIYNIECVTDCEIIECNYEEMINLSEKDIEIAIFIRKSIEKLYVSYLDRNVDFLTKDASERYNLLLKKMPEIENLLSQNEIASHLAISKMQLNRLRKNLKNYS